MLLADYLFHVADRLIEIWEALNIFAIRDICRRIADAENHMTASADWQIYMLKQAGKSSQEIQKEVQKTLRISAAEVTQIFEESLLSGYEADKKLYSEAGIETEPFNTAQARKDVQVYLEQTNNELYNFTRTTANQSQTIYINAADGAFMKVKSGLQSHDQAIKEAIDSAASDGLYVKYPTGWKDTVEVAVRRAVMTGVNQASLRLTVDECKRQGTNYVIVSSHLGARTGKTKHANHHGWQGGIYRLENRAKNYWGNLEVFNDIAPKKTYPLLSDATGYPDDPTGLGGYNCRHSMYPYIPGISENHMQVFDAKENAERYAESQEQRRLERKIRRTKRMMAGQEAGAEGATNTQTRDTLLRAQEGLRQRFNTEMTDYTTYCMEHGLTEQRERLYTVTTP